MTQFAYSLSKAIETVTLSFYGEHSVSMVKCCRYYNSVHSSMGGAVLKSADQLLVFVIDECNKVSPCTAS